jgi:site-specific DNA recombinase
MTATLKRNGDIKHLRNGHDRAILRCAVYTRKSTEEGLEQEFNTLDAQRESGEAYIKSQAHEGWQCSAERYDDGGFSGGSMDRPALKRLLADIEANRIQVVVVYKVDRLSRSLLDFARMMEVFDQHNVAFVSVTQQINSVTSMGRLMLNVLLSFAQFEREIIGERTRDKIAATRRKGKWAGGHPILGYDIDPHGLRLVVNDIEATQVRAIFQLYLDHEATLPVVRELLRRGWRNKRWITRKGRDRGGKVFTRTSLHKLLTNIAYVGKIRYKSEVHQGEQAAIVDEGVWQRVQATLRRNYVGGSAAVRNKTGALLKGLITCTACGCAMSPTHSTRGGNKHYRYYVCSKAQKLGRETCPAKSIPAGEIERFVVNHIKAIGKDPDLVQQVLAAAREQLRQAHSQIQAEQRRLERDIAQWTADVGIVAQRVAGDTAALRQLADLQERIRHAEQQLADLRAENASDRDTIHEHEVAAALSGFDAVWSALAPREQARVLHLLIEQVGYDGAAGRVTITFHLPGLKALAVEAATQARKRA